MNSRLLRTKTGVAVAMAALLGAGGGLAGCDRETSTHKESSSKVVDTPDGKKKVTETTETTTTTDRKD